MKEFKKLWDNKSDPQGRIDITFYFINVLLILVHLFFLGIYILVHHRVMIYIDMLLLFIYSMFLNYSYKKKKVFVLMVALTIWTHMLLAISSFGWGASYQNWAFAIITALFLPVRGYEEEGKLNRYSYIFLIIVVTSFFIYSEMDKIVDFNLYIDISEKMMKTIFIANNIITFFTIIMLATFYTSVNKRKQNDLSRKADFDELTNLYNRNAIKHISSVLMNAARESKQPFHVAIIDIDYFKKVNDTYGHASGDLVLNRLADILRQFTVKGVFAARWGGEEFVMICSSSHDYDYFTSELEKLRQKVSKTKFITEHGDKIDIRISIGSASIDYPTDLEECVIKADERLYKAKETGRNKLVSK